MAHLKNKKHAYADCVPSAGVNGSRGVWGGWWWPAGLQASSHEQCALREARAPVFSLGLSQGGSRAFVSLLTCRFLEDTSVLT